MKGRNHAILLVGIANKPYEMKPRGNAHVMMGPCACLSSILPHFLEIMLSSRRFNIDVKKILGRLVNPASSEYVVISFGIFQREDSLL